MVLEVELGFLDNALVHFKPDNLLWPSQLYLHITVNIIVRLPELLLISKKSFLLKYTSWRGERTSRWRGESEVAFNRISPFLFHVVSMEFRDFDYTTKLKITVTLITIARFFLFEPWLLRKV
jgi:hypothetical protein